MPVTQENSAPYAGSSTIISLILRHRQKGLPSPIVAETLERCGISESLVPRTLQALQILDLIDASGEPTEMFESLRLSSESDYKAKFNEWLRTAYADALQFIDLEGANEIQIRDAFRKYKPVGQQDRMVSLFIGLFEEAGVVIERKRNKSKPNGKPEIVRRNKSTSDKGAIPPKAVPNLKDEKPAEHGQSAGIVRPADPALVTKLLDKFPVFDPTWSADIQEKWFDGYQRLLAMDQKK